MDAHQFSRNVVAHVADLFDGGGFVHSQIGIRFTRTRTRPQPHLEVPSSCRFRRHSDETQGRNSKVGATSPKVGLRTNGTMEKAKGDPPRFNTSAYKTLERQRALLSYIRS